ncbi:hypothetical protein PENTCL1PPCAC_7918, partial [Pristionchus entomophagus]
RLKLLAVDRGRVVYLRADNRLYRPVVYKLSENTIVIEYHASAEVAAPISCPFLFIAFNYEIFIFSIELMTCLPTEHTRWTIHSFAGYHAEDNLISMTGTVRGKMHLITAILLDHQKLQARFQAQHDLNPFPMAKSPTTSLIIPSQTSNESMSLGMRNL